jgi:outer membrane protein OmpA-like peptidoglycan-associated protein
MRKVLGLAGLMAVLGLAAACAAGPGGPRATEVAAPMSAPALAPAPARAEAATTDVFAAQEQQLRTSLAETAAVIVRTPKALEVWYPVRLAFVPDGNELLPTGSAMLDLLAYSLREYEHSGIVVAVYTDAIGSPEYNQRQSEARAGVLVEALKSRGVAPARLIARGMGESAQLEAPNTPEGRDLNRRVQLVITPLSS